MNDRPGPGISTPAHGPADHRDRPSTRRPALTPTEVLPILPNLLATFAGFVMLMLAPWVCVHTLGAAWEDAFSEDQIATYFVLSNLSENGLNALMGALFFLVVGAILQAWRYLKPFPARRPMWLALPIAWVVLVPESLLRGGSVLCVAVVGASIAVAFGVHWGMVLYASEALGE